jgi:hypothetical protein
MLQDDSIREKELTTKIAQLEKVGMFSSAERLKHELAKYNKSWTTYKQNKPMSLGELSKHIKNSKKPKDRKV